MKKLLLSILLILSLFLIPSLASSNEYFVCVESISILKEANSTLENNIVEIKHYGDKILVNETEINDQAENSNLKYFPVLNEKNEVIGYILKSAVKKEESSIKTKLQTNAVLTKDSIVYKIQDEKFIEFVFNNEIIKLNKDCQIKVLEKFDQKNEYTYISFYYNDEILTGYVLTKNINVEGFNYYLILAIFIIVLIAATVIPIIVKNWKKHKKLANG